MAKDIATKKRKASVPEVEAEKVKKVKNVVASTTTDAPPAKKRKATEDAAPVKVKKTKTPKDVAEPTTTVAPKKASKATTSEEKVTEDTTKSKKKTPVADKKAIAPKSKMGPAASKKAFAVKEKIAKALKPEIVVDEEIDSGLEDEDNDMEEDSDEELDEKTVDILKGFESDADDKEIADGLPEGAEVPARKKLNKKEEKKLAKIKEAAASDKPGVVYVGRIPHGFYEHEMKAYFKQFGNILKLRISRNKKSGASKHFAWIQFESAEVADIVARTMDNYMMFSHILKVKLIPDEQVNPDWFKGANKRFKRIPWNKMEGRKLEQPKSESDWNAKNDLEKKKREKKAVKLKEIGYEFEAPELKSATGVAKPKAAEELTNGESEVKPVEAAPVAEETTKSKKGGKKGKKVAAEVSAAETDNKAKNRAVTFPPPKEDVEESIDALIAEAAAKPKKGKKAKVVKEVEVVEALEETVAAVEEAKPVKEKKVKKTKVVETSEVPIAEPAEPAAAAAAPEKKLKTKKSKTSLVETVVPVVAPEEAVPVAKAKNNKKRKASSG